MTDYGTVKMMGGSPLDAKSAYEDHVFTVPKMSTSYECHTVWTDPQYEKLQKARDYAAAVRARKGMVVRRVTP